MSKPASHIQIRPTTVDRAKRNLDFLEWDIEAIEPGHKAQQTTGRRKRRAPCRKLEFGETDPSVLLTITDELPNLDDFLNATTGQTPRGRRTRVTSEQKLKLMEMFQRKKFPSRREKEALGVELGLTIHQIQSWFSYRRKLWRKQRPESRNSHRDALVVCPVLTAVQTNISRMNRMKVTRECAMQSRPSSAARAHNQPFTAVLPSATALATQIFIPDFSQYPSSIGSCFVSPSRLRLPWFSGLSRNGAGETPARSSDVPKTPGFCELPESITTSENHSRVSSPFPVSYSTALELSHIFCGLEDENLWSTPPTPSFNGFLETDALVPQLWSK